VKTTIDLPDDLFREAKATAARRGTALREFVREALSEKLAREVGTPVAGTGAKTWPVAPPVGIDPSDATAIDAAIEEAFEQIEPDHDDWA
jgi:hypothetical protein